MRPSVDDFREAPAGDVLCLVPGPVGSVGDEALVRFLIGRRGLAVLRERRSRDRRRAGEDRRSAARGRTELEPGGASGCDAERRRIAGSGGRRVGERRAVLLPFRVPAAAVPGREGGLYRLVVFAQRRPHPAGEIERLRSGWLVTQVQAGVASAFDELYGLYWDRTYRSLERGLKDPERAADATQEVLVRALRALPRFDASTGHFGRWLATIARNYLTDLFRSADRVRVMDPGEVCERLELDHLHDASAVPAPDRTTDLFMARLRCLPLAQQQVLFLRYVVDLPWDDIALLLGRSSAAVRMLQARAHGTLRARQAG